MNIALGDLRKAGGKAFTIGFISAAGKAIISAFVVMALGLAVFAIKYVAACLDIHPRGILFVVQRG
ncbi:MAG: hypothetical protein R6V60_15550 [Desulfobacterales bacterium]